MPDFTYPIFPSESFLLGLCHGEYSASSEPFLAVIRRRLLPFYPQRTVSMPSQSPRLLEPRLDSGEMQWLTSPATPDAEYAYTADYPETLFVRRGSEISHFSFPNLPRPFVDTVLECLDGSLCWAPFDSAIIGKDMAKSVFQNLHGVEPPGSVKRSVERQSVTERLEMWTKTSGNHDFFRQGRVLGKLIHTIRSAICLVIQATDDGRTDEIGDIRVRLTEELPKVAEEVQRLTLVSFCGHADLAINELLRQTQVSLRYSRLPIPYEGLASELELHWESHWTLAWVAVGAIVGSLRDDDAEAKVRDASSAIPRNLRSGDSVDQIRQQLLIADTSLASNTGQQTFPQMSIRQSGHAIESLSRRLWGNEMDRAPNRRLFFESIIRNGTKLETRFASIAKDLLLNYRNPAEHEPGFRCSLTEARFFLAGVHTLLDLHDQILAQRSPK